MSVYRLVIISPCPLLEAHPMGVWSILACNTGVQQFAPFARANQRLLWRVGKGVNTARTCCCMTVRCSCVVPVVFWDLLLEPHDCQSFSTYVPRLFSTQLLFYGSLSPDSTCYSAGFPFMFITSAVPLCTNLYILPA
eukprot:sb/3474517/